MHLPVARKAAGGARFAVEDTEFPEDVHDACADHLWHLSLRPEGIGLKAPLASRRPLRGSEREIHDVAPCHSRRPCA
jgi:hypothetical protein